jgi:hypothetical protein
MQSPGPRTRFLLGVALGWWILGPLLGVLLGAGILGAIIAWCLLF